VKASVWRGTPAEVSVEARLAALEANLATLRTEQAETAKELQEMTRKMNEAVDAERRVRDSAVTALRLQLEGLAVRGLHVEMMGVFWLVLGVVLATIPGEIAAALKWRL
jgi:chromosome segregation ATPase